MKWNRIGSGVGYILGLSTFFESHLSFRKNCVLENKTIYIMHLKVYYMQNKVTTTTSLYSINNTLQAKDIFQQN